LEYPSLPRKRKENRIINKMYNSSIASARALVNQWMSFKGKNIMDRFHYCREQFYNVIHHNQRTRMSDFPGLEKVVEVHINRTHGAMECKFVNKDTSVCTPTISTPRPLGVDVQAYKDGFSHFLGNSELPARELDVFPLVEKLNNSPSVEQLNDIICSICILFN